MLPAGYLSFSRTADPTGGGGRESLSGRSVPVWTHTAPRLTAPLFSDKGNPHGTGTLTLKCTRLSSCHSGPFFPGLLSIVLCLNGKVTFQHFQLLSRVVTVQGGHSLSQVVTHCPRVVIIPGGHCPLWSLTVPGGHHPRWSLSPVVTIRGGHCPWWSLTVPGGHHPGWSLSGAVTVLDAGTRFARPVTSPFSHQSSRLTPETLWTAHQISLPHKHFH